MHYTAVSISLDLRTLVSPAMFTSGAECSEEHSGVCGGNAHHRFSHVAGGDNALFLPFVRLRKQSKCLLDLIFFLCCDTVLLS